MNDLETELARLPLRATPTDWRQEILQAAQTARTTEVPAWWRRWLSPPRLALTAAWLLILLLRFATPDQTPAAPGGNMAGWRQHIEERQAAIARLLTPPAAPESAPPHPRGAFFLRLPNSFV